MKRVSAYVEKQSNETQEPWTQSSLRTPFYFNAGSLVWFVGNIIGFGALLAMIAIHALVIIDNPGWQYITPVLALLAIVILLFLLGIDRAYRVVRGELSVVSRGVWRRGLIGGLYGGIFAALIVAPSYYFTWDTRNYNQESFGLILAEITLACTFAGTTLGSLSYVFARRIPATRFLSKAWAGAIGGVFGGVAAGLIVGPVLTWYFGRFSRPPASQWVLLPGGLVSVLILIFAIITYDIERVNYRRLLQNMTASAGATLIVAAASGVAFFSGADIVSRLVGAAVSSYPSELQLAEIGLAAGTVVGGILGSAISLALFFIEIGKAGTATEP